jgi:CheY-like chemotaxis protein
MPSAQVLVIDDDGGVRVVLSALLRELGHTVRTAETAVDGIILMSPTTPDVVLLDLAMPGISGLDALTHFRHHYPDVPIIVVTGVLEADTLERARAEGAFDVLSKPFTLAGLAEMLDRATQRRSSP